MWRNGRGGWVGVGLGENSRFGYSSARCSPVDAAVTLYLAAPAQGQSATMLYVTECGGRCFVQVSK